MIQYGGIKQLSEYLRADVGARFSGQSGNLQVSGQRGWNDL